MDSINCWEGGDQFQYIHSNLNLSSVSSLQEVLKQARTLSLSVEDSLVHLLHVTLISILCRSVLFNCIGLFCDLRLKFHIIGFYLPQKNCGIGLCESFKIKPSISPQILKNNYHSGIRKWFPSESELWKEVCNMDAYKTWLACIARYNLLSNAMSLYVLTGLLI